MTSQRHRATPATGRLYAQLWRWHFLAALLVIPFVVWQSTTGVLYLWSEWWMDVRHPEMRFVGAADHDAPPSKQIAASFTFIAQSRNPDIAQIAGTRMLASADQVSEGVAVQEILIADDPHRSTIVLFRDASGLPYPVFVDPHDAAVIGVLAPSAWLPGISRALHGGWPLGRPGSWLLELGDGWAIVMILTGLYLWWPRGRSLLGALWPRFHAGPGTMIRDLHAIVAVLFSAVFLFFLISALPWTAFWGGTLLPRLEQALGQSSPAGFSFGGASVARITPALASIDQIVAAPRARSVAGTLDIRLGQEPGAPLFVANRNNAPADDRTLLGDPKTGEVTGDFGNADLPFIPRFVALVWCL